MAWPEWRCEGTRAVRGAVASVAETLSARPRRGPYPDQETFVIRRPTLWRVAALPMDDRLDHLQQSVDAVAIEVERIGEAQRFSTKLHAERAEPRQ